MTTDTKNPDAGRQAALEWVNKEATVNITDPAENCTINLPKIPMDIWGIIRAALAQSQPPVSDDKHEREMLNVIDERDSAQEAISQAYYLIIGQSPEWSNVFGYKEAIEEIDLAQRSLRAHVAKPPEQRPEAVIDALKHIAGYEISDSLNYYNARAMIERAREALSELARGKGREMKKKLLDFIMLIPVILMCLATIGGIVAGFYVAWPCGVTNTLGFILAGWFVASIIYFQEN